MKQPELEGLITQTLGALSSSTLSPITVRKYRRDGLDLIGKHFKEQKVDIYSESMVDEFVLNMRAAYENGEMGYQKWYALRKSAALLSSMHHTGELSAKILPKWKVTQNPLRREPSVEQLDNKDDIFTLVYLTKQEMKKLEYSPSTMKRYTWQGFDPILRNCMKGGCGTYSKERIREIVETVRNNPDETYRVRLNIQRAALMLDEFYETGKLEWRQLSHEQPRYLSEHFSAALDKYSAESDAAGIYSDGTTKSDRIAIRQLLFLLEDMGHKHFGTITLKDMSNCISLVAKQNPSLSYLSYIRRFLKHIHKQNETSADLSLAIPRLVPPRTVIQEGFTPDEIRSLLNCVDRDTAKGKRDYAIMSLAAQTGLRTVDITNLKRNAVDWRAKTICITQEKTKRAVSMALPVESGNAIADYILTGRPESELPFIFLTARIPFRRPTSATISAMVTFYMRRAGIADSSGCRKGSHSFRRALGGRLLESETPIELISEILGHSRMNSAKPYLSANEAGLKDCALGIIPQENPGDAL